MNVKKRSHKNVNVREIAQLTNLCIFLNSYPFAANRKLTTKSGDAGFRLEWSKIDSNWKKDTGFHNFCNFSDLDVFMSTFSKVHEILEPRRPLEKLYILKANLGKLIRDDTVTFMTRLYRRSDGCYNVMGGTIMRARPMRWGGKQGTRKIKGTMDDNTEIYAKQKYWF